LNGESDAKKDDERRRPTGPYHGVPLGGLEEREGKLHKNKIFESDATTNHISVLGIEL
jgi:hypothetical protein